MQTRCAVWVAALCFHVGLAQWSIASTTYSITNLGDLPGGNDSSLAVDINSLGQIAGYSDASTGRRAFLWTPSTPNGTTGSMIDLGDLPGGDDFSRSRGINDSGQVTGWSGAMPGGSIFGSRAFLWTPATPNGTTGSMTDLGTLPEGGDASLGFAINAYGQVTGNTSGSGAADRGFLWTPSTPNGTTGSMTPLGALSDSGWSHGLAINASGQVTGDSDASTGRRAFLWTPSTTNGAAGSMVDVGDLPGGDDNSLGAAINVSGQVAGWSYASTGLRAFLWTPSTPNGNAGSMIDLGDLPGGLDRSEATAISGSGHVVGWSDGSTGMRAFLWTSAEGMLDLNALLDPSGAEWVVLEQAQGINDVGQIAGFGLFDPDGPGDAAAVRRGFLLTPVPEPAGLMLMALASGATLLRFRRTSTRTIMVTDA